ncbi:hypothetical protein VC83_00881 [Pseudogymnoascus destructans]|uniref:Uncharacterized protein n=1 Tax=Pseudogymnoascus destructans TaxID=655981 RepID=A0A177AL08_9PEZI|nr:uncharacterized protein VC83_00881 [Pseudogymnoascus destructans]OAF62490.1 hypothetical protein VC83_00881 [Pseudogymnoascus destructans]
MYAKYVYKYAKYVYKYTKYGYTKYDEPQGPQGAIKHPKLCMQPAAGRDLVIIHCRDTITGSAV